MNFYKIFPEVPGGLGEETDLHRDPENGRMQVTRLHYHFEDWLGDSMITSCPVYLVTSAVAREFGQLGITGTEFAPAKLSKSREFRVRSPGLKLPQFVWLKPIGKGGADDVGLSADLALVISERVLRILQAHGLKHSTLKPFEQGADALPEDKDEFDAFLDEIDEDRGARSK